MMDRALLNNALDAALHLGAAEAEAVLIRDVSLGIEVAQGQVETLQLAESIGIGARLFTQDHRMGFAYASLPSVHADAKNLETLVGAAWQNAVANAPDPHNVLPDESSTSDDDWSQQDFSQMPTAEKVEFCRELEAKTLAADKRVARVDKAAYGDSHIEYVIANTRGAFRQYRNAHASCSAVAAAAEPGADSEIGWEFDFGRTFDALRPDWVAQRCAQRATQGLGGKPCETRSTPVVLDNYVASQFLGVIGPALMANNVLKGKSLFAGRIGETIGSDLFTLVDQNDLESGMNRAPFDAEGVTSQRTVLIDGGVLRGYLHNAHTAHRMGQPHTANAARGGGFRSAPEVGASNAFLSPGKESIEALWEMAGDGLFVTDAMGVHTADPISGDFSFGVAGLKIEHGRLAGPVRGVTVAGNIKDLLKNIRAIASDLRFFGAYGAPSMLISEIQVSGA